MLIKKAQLPGTKQQLRLQTEKASQLGIFGGPYFHRGSRIRFGAMTDWKMLYHGRLKNHLHKPAH